MPTPRTPEETREVYAGPATDIRGMVHADSGRIDNWTAEAERWGR
jgi:hypothetical protein